jgi:signal peptidase I
MTALVLLSSAVICLSGKCYPVLVGRDTPTGVYNITKRLVLSPGYGGDVLQFKETDKYVYAIHRVWLLNPSQHREERLQSHNVEDRRNITGGCINVSPDVYDKLQVIDTVDIEP